MSGARRSSRRLRLPLLVVAASLAVLIGGSAVAAYGYERSANDRILPGIRIAGVDVGGMTAQQALEAVRKKTKLVGRKITIRVADERVRSPLFKLGVKADVEGAVAEALGASQSMSWVSRVYHRITDRPVDLDIDVTLSYRSRPSYELVNELASEVEEPAVNAAIQLVDGDVVFRHAKPGHTLDTSAALDRLMDAVREGQAHVRLPLRPVAPRVTDDVLGKTITVDLTTNTLRLYDGFDVIRTFDVGTAAQGYSTPPGTWTVYNKVENPSWYNPCPDGGCWAAGEPPVIPPGPNNPLGTRALYIDAPGIRIHGTPSTSSVGYYVSHGCIRMRMWEVEELYPLVPIGTKVLIYGSPPWGTGGSGVPGV